MDRDNPNFLGGVSHELCAIIAKYDLENVYNVDEAALCFRLLPRHTLLMPFEDVSGTRS